jgi:hypothetical protein
MRALLSLSSALALAALLAACGPSAPATADASPGVDGATGTCTGSQTRCFGNNFQTCQNGHYVDQQVCTEDCSDTLGCVACNPSQGQVCVGDEVHTCNTDGSIGGLVRTCAAGECVAGSCQDPCGQAAANRSYIGCEYWPVDLDNAVEVLDVAGGEYCTGSTGNLTLNVCYYDYMGLYQYVLGTCSADEPCEYVDELADTPTCQSESVCVLDAQHSPFAIVVSNPDASASASVTLSNAGGQTYTTSVGPGAVTTIYPQSNGFADQSIDGSSQSAKAYKLVSDRPIVAYQFNPLNNTGVFSNDGSLLLPQHTFDVEYFAATYPTLARRPYAHDYSGYVTIVASAPGSTSVTVSPSCAIRPNGSFAAFSGDKTFTLNQFDVLNLEAVSGGDLTGTYVNATQPVGVYGGHEATVLSSQAESPCCADHLEDQLFPMSTWGWNYVVAHSAPRAVDGVTVNDPELVRIVAQRSGTTVSISPSGSCGTLNAGQHCDIWIGSDTVISSDEDHPILLGHYLTSIIATGATDATHAGDPSLAYAVPVEQYRESYTFLVPKDYTDNYVSIVAPASANVTLDGTDVSADMTTVSGGAYKAVYKSLGSSEGQHTVTCPESCGIEVYGWSDAVSYLFAGGLDLNQIVVD